MKNNEIKYAIKSHDMYMRGLIAGANALISRSSNFLIFNSLLAVAFVGTLQEGFPCEWEKILIIGIPILAILLNISWLWLGNRTMLSQKFFFQQVEDIEEEFFKKDERITGKQPYLLCYAGARKKLWEENKKGLLRLISSKGGADKLFCFFMPLISFVAWAGILTFHFFKRDNYILASISLGIGTLIVFLFNALKCKITNGE